jgi:hypothetical protein
MQVCSVVAAAPLPALAPLGRSPPPPLLFPAPPELPPLGLPARGPGPLERPPESLPPDVSDPLPAPPASPAGCPPELRSGAATPASALAFGAEPP